MFKLLGLIILLTVLSEINSINNARDKNCISDILFFNRNNFSASKSTETNITVLSSVFRNSNSDFVKKSSGYEISVNETLQEELVIFPHNFVPEIGDSEKDFINVLSERMMKIQPPFDLSHVNGVTKLCQLDSRKFLDALRNFELWALKMHDSSAKLNSGILNGNLNQYGDFDQCLDVTASKENYQGQYCLAYLQPSAPNTAHFLNYLRRIIQSHEVFTSNFDDPGHRVPRFSTINWAVCVPSTCTPNDVELVIKDYIARFIQDTGLTVKVKVDSEMCQVKDVKWIENLDRNTMIALGFFLSVLIISILSSIYDYQKEENQKNPWLVAFSLIKNTKELVSVKHDSSDIPTAHSIRFFNAIMLIISHKCMAMFFNPYVNRTEMSEAIGQSWTVLGRAASLYTDPFLMLSGMLTAYSLFGRLQKGHKIKIFQEYAGRYLRIMPPLAALILFCTYVLPLLGSGPQWNLVVTHHSGICKQYWWRNLLFIHNWFGFKEMCLTHTHHVGIDTELFVLAPIMVLMLWKWPKKSSILIFVLALISTYARFYVTYTKGLSNYVFFGTSVTQLFETADRMYILPPHRFTVYAMGIILGYILRTYKDIKLTQTQLTMGWYISITLLFSAFFGPAPMGDIDYKFNPTHAAHYAAFAPIAWCLFFAWIIFTSQLGYKNKFIDILEWKGFQITTRLSYSIYLTQFPVFFYNVGRVRNPIHFGFIKIVLNSNELLWMVFVSALLTIFIEFPFSNIKQIIFKKRRKSIENSSIKLDLNANIKHKHNHIKNMLD